MARKKQERKKGLLDRAIDAVSTRDEKEAAEEAKKAADAAKHQATLEAARRQAAEAKARAAEEKVKAAEKAAAEAKAQAARLERDKKLAEAATRREESLARLRRQAEERKPRVYVVKSGDSLSKIAKEVLGDASRWPEIFEANKDQIKDPNLIYPGQELYLPS
jgi:nucleoid-associated protein YgaU